MIGLDTNVLLRLVVGDDARQAETAAQFVEAHCSPDQPGFICLIVLCELAWTLSRAYRYERKAIAEAIDLLLQNRVLAFEEPNRVAAALRTFRAATVEFPDVLIAETNRAHGRELTATFDERAAKLEGFVMVR